MYDKRKTMEAEAEAAAPPSLEVRDTKVAHLFEVAVVAVSESKFEDAEKLYLDILRLDQHSVEAYRGLSDVYIEQISYNQAKETLEFLRNLYKDDDRAFACLGAIEVFKGNFREAEERFMA